MEGGDPAVEPARRPVTPPWAGVAPRALYLLGLCAALKAAGLVAVAQGIATAIADPAAGRAPAAGTLAIGVAGALLQAVAHWAGQVAARRAALGEKERLRARLTRRAVDGAGRDLPGTGAGSVAVLATRGLDDLDHYYTQYLPALVGCAVVPLLVGLRILAADWVSALIVVLTVPLVPVFMVLIGLETRDAVDAAAGSLSRLSDHLVELARGLPVLVGLGRAGAQLRALRKLSEDYRSRTMETLKVAFLSSLALELIATISVAVVAVFIGVRLIAGQLDLQLGLLALILAPECYLPLRQLGAAYHASDDGLAARARAQDMIDAAPMHRLAVTGSASDAGDGQRPLTDVTVEDLTITYHGRARAAVTGLDLTAPAGAITALAGPSGCGKSSVLAVLAGTLGDHPAVASVSGRVRGIHPHRVAWLSQHPVTTEPTVAAEVRAWAAAAGSGPADAEGHADPAGAPAADLDAEALVGLLLARVGLADHADAEPGRLSPGQLRRLGLARVLARVERGATVVLLDEPTAHLDTATARVMGDVIDGLRGRVTVVLVAHSRATLALADSVVELPPPAAPEPVGSASEQGPGRAGAAAAILTALPTPGARVDVVTPVLPEGSATVAAGAGSVDLGASDPGPSVATTTGARGRASTTSDAGAPAAATGRGRPLATWRALRLALNPLRPRFLGAVLVGTLSTLFAVTLTALSGWLIVRASEQPPILYLLAAIVGVRFFGIGRSVLRYLERLWLHDAVFAALTDLRTTVWRSLGRRAGSLRVLARGEVAVSRLIGDVDQLRDLAPRVLLPPIVAVTTAVGVLIATALLAPPLLGVQVAALVAVTVLAPVVALLADRRAVVAEQRIRGDVLRRTAALILAAPDLRANAVAERFLAGLGAADGRATAAARRATGAQGAGGAVIILALLLSAVTMTAISAGPMLAGALDPEAVAVVVLTQLALVDPFLDTVTAVQQLPALRSAVDRFADLTGPEQVTPRTRLEDEREAGPVSAAPLSAAELAGAVFAWPAAGRPRGGTEPFAAGRPRGGTEPFAVGPVSGLLPVPGAAGGWLVVTGPSGSGKSTLLSGLLGFLPTSQGPYLLDGHPVVSAPESTAGRHRLSRIAWCPQDAHLFDSSLRANLLLARPRDDAPTEDRLRRALDAVGLGDLLADLPDGLDTRIGASGNALSGGQRMRVAIARTLLAEGELVLLDEPTAHLDTASAEALMADLRRGLRNRMVVLVTHDPTQILPGDAVIDLPDPARGPVLAD
ncbi:glutathione/cysteine ABC transporter permease/ATPase [Tersicoccus solisilvae]|uniref:Glutathione/cysteine ABC transporter permease/ATPase n=1 Tax=Tersicoccus solisilvae TaxID=1882339 RepID=A0ABQ1PLU9_9MICC|nr:glutathione/cysteine ABC transporter permease/ATPase [Tersicoccus solisilvae]